MSSNRTAVIVPPPKAPATSTNLQDIHDIRPPIPISSSREWLIGTAIVLALVLLAWWLWRHRRRDDDEALTVTVPAHLRALRALDDALRAISEPKPFCIRVSDILRGYLEERFGLHAPERTTEEFLVELQSSPHLNETQKSRLSEFLLQCDLVKFARHEPSEENLRALHHTACQLVDETAPEVAGVQVAAKAPTA